MSTTSETVSWAPRGSFNVRVFVVTALVGVLVGGLAFVATFIGVGLPVAIAAGIAGALGLLGLGLGVVLGRRYANYLEEDSRRGSFGGPEARWKDARRSERTVGSVAAVERLDVNTELLAYTGSQWWWPLTRFADLIRDADKEFTATGRARGARGDPGRLKFLETTFGERLNQQYAALLRLGLPHWVDDALTTVIGDFRYRLSEYRQGRQMPLASDSARQVMYMLNMDGSKTEPGPRGTLGSLFHWGARTREATWRTAGTEALREAAFKNLRKLGRFKHPEDKNLTVEAIALKHYIRRTANMLSHNLPKPE